MKALLSLELLVVALATYARIRSRSAPRRSTRPVLEAEEESGK